MFEHLDIHAPRERWAVGAADLVLSALALPDRLLGTRARHGPPRRVLLLRLERIGDLLMTLGAIRAVRQLVPGAEIDLVVGSWNEEIARLVPEVTRVETLDLPWLARGASRHSPQVLAGRAASWRSRRYDLAINFEGDIRTHALMRIGGASRRVGFAHAGGRPLLTDVVAHDAGRHVADNSLALVERAFDLPAGTLPRASTPEGAPLWRLHPPEEARGAARAVVRQLTGSGAAFEAPWLAVHAAAGRLVKQWPVDRFADAAATLAHRTGATVIITGGPGDRDVVAGMQARLETSGVPSVRAEGTLSLVVFAALLAQCRLLLTADTGPMHLAAAVETPVVAVFGPSMPWRYGPLVEPHRVVRVDLPCSPCNRIRRPPERCQGHVPDCLAAVDTASVVAAGLSLLASSPQPAGAPAR
jgi:ADP-heptose:LPS heptosyltransferase